MFVLTFHKILKVCLLIFLENNFKYKKHKKKKKKELFDKIQEQNFLNQKIKLIYQTPT